MDTFDNWTVQVRKGILEVCILNALREEERYGYDLVKTLVALPGLGVTEGTAAVLSTRCVDAVAELNTNRASSFFSPAASAGEATAVIAVNTRSV